MTNNMRPEAIEIVLLKPVFEFIKDIYGAKAITVGINNKWIFDLINFVASYKYGRIELFINVFYYLLCRKYFRDELQATIL